MLIKDVLKFSHCVRFFENQLILIINSKITNIGYYMLMGFSNSGPSEVKAFRLSALIKFLKTDFKIDF